ncbi:hypothetical protein [Cellulomonas hominis]|uniref:hypothetical protein n=1 Tax=Cellulomonas hominis TaxID=156981 RepID=UPI0014442070|nr:hypothetical protein [Cellulomonas hominis]NKY08952.1 hypothetical protein [Cellulomonas hominis]
MRRERVWPEISPPLVAIPLGLVWLALVVAMTGAAVAAFGGSQWRCFWAGICVALIADGMLALVMMTVMRVADGFWALPDLFVFSGGGVLTLCLFGATAVPAIALFCGQG